MVASLPHEGGLQGQEHAPRSLHSLRDAGATDNSGRKIHQGCGKFMKKLSIVKVQKRWFYLYQFRPGLLPIVSLSRRRTCKGQRAAGWRSRPLRPGRP